MLSLSANPDFKVLDNAQVVNPYYDWDAMGVDTEVLGKTALDQMIENVLLTEPFERLFNLAYGSPIYLLLFENFSNVDSLMPQVFEIIEHWVPIKIHQSQAEITKDEDHNALLFKIPYTSNNGLISGIFARRIRK